MAKPTLPQIRVVVTDAVPTDQIAMVRAFEERHRGPAFAHLPIVLQETIRACETCGAQPLAALKCDHHGHHHYCLDCGRVALSLPRDATNMIPCPADWPEEAKAMVALREMGGGDA